MMKGAFVCPAACEPLGLFMRLFYQDGKKRCGGLAWKSAEGVGGWELGCKLTGVG